MQKTRFIKLLWISFVLVLVSSKAYAINFQLFKSKSLSGETVMNESTQAYSPGSYELSGSFGFARNLLEFGNPSTGQRISSVVKNLLSLDLFLGYGIIDNFRIELNLPIYLYVDSASIASLPEESKIGIGDVFLKGHYSISESSPTSSSYGLALAPFFQSKIVGGGKYLRSSNPSGGLVFAADRWINGKHYFNSNLGMKIASKETIFNLEVGGEFLLGAGYGYTLADELMIGTEIAGRTALTNPFGSSLQSPAELLVYLRSSPAVKKHWILGSSLGLTSGYGSPEVRVFFTTGLSSQARVFASDNMDPLTTMPKKIEKIEPSRVITPIQTPLPLLSPEPAPQVLSTPIPLVPVPTPETKGELRLSVVNQKGIQLKATIYLIKSDRTFQERFEATNVSRKVDQGKYHIIVDSQGFKRVHEELQLSAGDVLARTIVMEPVEKPKMEKNHEVPVPVIEKPAVRSNVTLKPSVRATPAPKSKPTPKPKPTPTPKPTPRPTPKPAPTATPKVQSSSGNDFKSGIPIALPSPITFEKGKTALVPSSFKGLQHVIKYMKTHPEIKKLSIQATVGDGDKKGDNEDLAFSRADIILEFFVNAGIDPKRLTSNGKASSSIGMQNVDFIILKTGGK